MSCKEKPAATARTMTFFENAASDSHYQPIYRSPVLVGCFLGSRFHGFIKWAHLAQQIKL